MQSLLAEDENDKQTGAEIDEKTGEIRCTGESQHCFLDSNGHPISIKRELPELNQMFIEMTDNK